MMTDNSRESLGFTEAARAAFAFLTEYGFSEVQAVATLLRLSNESIEIEIYHGRQSYEIGLVFSYEGERFSLSELLCADGGSLECGYQNPVAQNGKEVTERLQEVACTARQSLLECLGDVDGCVERLRAVNMATRQALADESLASSVRPKADAAFRRKDYETAARLYESIKGQLSPSEIERVRIAKQRTQL